FSRRSSASSGSLSPSAWIRRRRFWASAFLRSGSIWLRRFKNSSPSRSNGSQFPNKASGFFRIRRDGGRIRRVFPGFPVGGFRRAPFSKPAKGAPGCDRLKDLMPRLRMGERTRDKAPVNFSGFRFPTGFCPDFSNNSRRQPGPPARFARWFEEFFCEQNVCRWRSEEHTSELQSRENLVCRL